MLKPDEFLASWEGYNKRMKVSFQIEEKTFSGEPFLGATLTQFLAELGESEIAPVLESEDGKLVGTDYTLAHFCNGRRFKVASKVSAQAATTAQELLPSCSPRG